MNDFDGCIVVTFEQAKEELEKIEQQLAIKHSITDNNLKAYEATLSDYQKAYAFHVKDIELAQKEWIDKNYIIPSHLKDVADIADYANHTSDLGNKYSYYELSVIH